MPVTVAVDAMGGDHGPHVTVPAALEFQRARGDVAFVLVGPGVTIERELAAHGARPGRSIPRCWSRTSCC